MKKKPPLKEGLLTPKRIKSTTKKHYRLGIMGGTFNPIHYGHLLCAEQARCKFKLEEVVFVPAGLPPHKQDRDIAPPEHRYIMAVLATSANPHFSVSRVEVDRPGPSYAVDTIQHFADRYKDYNPKIYFITGCDAVMEILSWRTPEKIMRSATIIAASRPGYDFNRLKTTVGAASFRRLRLLQASALAISSTDIRARRRNGRPIKYLLPDTVEQYIYKYDLYRDSL